MLADVRALQTVYEDPVEDEDGDPQHAHNHHTGIHVKRTDPQMFFLKATSPATPPELQKAIKEKKIKVHRGFQALGLAQFKLLRQALRYWLRDRLRIVFVGHSLGGAMAQLGAVYARRFFPEMADRPEVYTFGSPRVGDKLFSQMVESLTDHIGVRTGGDPVPRIPVNLPFIEYRHGCRVAIQLPWATTRAAATAAVPATLSTTAQPVDGSAIRRATKVRRDG